MEDYLIVMIIMDCLLINEDRHYNNFGALYSNGIYTTLPLFDFGLGLFEHDIKYDGLSMERCVPLADCKPFSEDCRKPVEMLFSIGLSSKVAKFMEGLHVPNKELFPNDVAYEYFGETVGWIRSKLC